MFSLRRKKREKSFKAAMKEKREEDSMCVLGGGGGGALHREFVVAEFNYSSILSSYVKMDEEVFFLCFVWLKCEITFVMGLHKSVHIKGMLPFIYYNR